jgi:sugar phosphate isomerase/epimerase
VKAQLQPAVAPARLPARGLALYSVRAEAGRDLEATLARAAALGFQEIEMRAVAPEVARQHRALLDRHGLRCPSIVAGPDVPPAAQIESTRILGAGWLAVPALPVYFNVTGGRFAWRPRIEPADFAPMPKMLNDLARGCAGAGVRLAYHMHDNDFVPLSDGFSPFDRLAREVDPKLMDFELDLGHLHAARPDLPALLMRLRGRVPLVHLKDFVPGRSNEPKGAAMDNVGAGAIDFDALLPTLRVLGARHFFIELEAATAQWDGVQRSSDWLATRGFF